MNQLVSTPRSLQEFSLPAGMGAPEAREQSTQTNLLAIAWQGRWLILLCVLLGTATSWALLERAKPRFTSTSRIYVERSQPRLLDGDAALVYAGNYLNTQAELIRSTAVLAAAVEQPEMQALQTIREADNSVGLLGQAVTVAVGQSDDIINISAELPNATDAAQAVNSIVDAYISKYAEDRRTDLVGVLNILRNEKVRRDEELETCRKRLDDFRRQHIGLTVQVNDENVVNQRFGMLASELNDTEIQLLQTKARYTRIKEMYDTPSQRPFLLEMATGESTNLRDANLEQQVQEVEQALTTELARWGEGYPRVKLLKKSLADLKTRLTDQREKLIEGFVDSLQQEYELLQHKREELQLAYDEQFKLATDIGAQAVTLDSLRTELTRAEQNCELVDERIKQINLSEEVGAMNVSVMEVARPGYQSYPQRSKFLGMGVVLGGMCGFGLAWLRDLMDHRLKSIDEFADVLQLPVLGAIPLLAGERSRQELGRIVVDQPRSSAAEAIRTLRTGLHFSLGGSEIKLIVVTSPSPGDGKSTVASNLAIAMSQVDPSVLLIDADMRKPKLSEIFGVDSELGLSSVLAERLPPIEAIHANVVGALDFLPCGRIPPNPAELLNNGYFAELLAELGERYSKIIIDSPPVMPVADGRVIAALCDCTLLVLRAESATRRLSLAARDELWRVRAQRLGVVVNAVPTRKQSYGYGGYGAYGTYGAGQEIAYGYDDTELKQLAALK